MVSAVGKREAWRWGTQACGYLEAVAERTKERAEAARGLTG